MSRRLIWAVLVAAVLGVSALPVCAAETTGTVLGTILGPSREPVADARVEAVAPAGRYAAASDAFGRFALIGMTPDTYTITVEKNGYAPATIGGVVVQPGSRVEVAVRLRAVLRTIAAVHSHAGGGVQYGAPTDTYTVTGSAARGPGIAASSGLATYSRGTVQAAIAAVPGVQQDQFANVVVRGGKVDDVVFSYDAVPIAQALIAEPGGNVIGAQLPTTGVGYTSVTLGGFAGGADDALGGVVDQTPLTGVYPARTHVGAGEGLFPAARDFEIQTRWATPDLRRRYALDAHIGSESIAYGDGRTFYPAEAATYGLSLASRADWSVSANAHIAAGAHDDVEFLALAGEATYDQYGTPFTGEFFDGAPVHTPSRIRGTYAIEKVQLLHTYAHAYARVRAYRSLYGSLTDAPFFDDLSFPNGVISYFGTQYGVLDGFGADVRDYVGERHDIAYGAEIREERTGLDQFVPTFNERVNSNPALFDVIGYASDRWRLSRTLSVEPALHAFSTRVERSDGHAYTDAALDPHLSATYRVGANLLRAAYDRVTVAPKPLETERRDSAQPGAPFAPLAPERASSFEVTYARTGPVAFSLTYFNKREHDRIDVIPQNFRSTIGSDEQPGTGIGIPQNVGDLNARGFDLAFTRAAFSLSATYVRAFSSSASQFGLNDLNAPAVAAGHLFPAGYVPDFTAIAAYRIRMGRASLVPVLSYESGYPYGNGTMLWVYGPGGRPERVPNDNFVNPGYNFYFLRDPSRPYDARSNPYVATLGTAEGPDPNTLRTPPQLLVSLNARIPLAAHAELLVDVANLLGVANPTQFQGNPYLIGPPGYAGGNPLYAAWYGNVFGNGRPYTLGNGVPTNDGTTPAVPWTYGTAGYVASSYPEARSIFVRLRLSL